MLLRPLMAPVLSLEQYSRVIAAFSGFHEILEQDVQAMSSRVDLPGYRYQPRLPLLVEDREALPPCPVTTCTAAPEVSRADELLGVLYVLEGATQGGRVIAPRVQQRLALSERSGARYFNFYRQDSWQEFRVMVEQCQHRFDYSLAVAAARTTFDNLYSHLDDCLGSSGD